MFGSKSRMIKRLQEEIKSLKAKEQLDKEEQARIEQRKIIEQENRNVKFFIDWSKMDVFSIERQYNYKGNGPTTIIGQWLDVNGLKTSKEWLLLCSIERHNELVKEYQEYKKNAS